MKSELIPLDGGAPIPITKDVTVVGRREFCDVRIDNPSLSKRHCVIVRTDGLLMVRDLATTNGTKVNGQKVLWAALLPNDRLTLGGTKFRVYLGPDAAASPSEQTTQLQPTSPQAERPVPPKGRPSPKGGGFMIPSPSTFPSSPPSDDDDDLIVLDDSEDDELFASSVAEDDSEILDLD
jgi:pSer/pThr/pTyr-binding forkhead associated (FHA) protein